MRVLIVEDERRLARALKQILEEQGYLTDLVYTGPDGQAYAESGIYDVILLDVMLPGKDGFQVAKALRQERLATPILMLTARDALSDKVSGLDSGADDYMTKPFAPEELLARVRALSRRQGEIVPDTLTFEDLSFSPTAATLKVGDKEVRLNRKETDILRLLMTRPGALLPKEEIITKVWGYDSNAGDGNVEAYISFLRRKLAFLDARVSITAVKKQGYLLEKRPC